MYHAQELAKEIADIHKEYENYKDIRFSNLECSYTVNVFHHADRSSGVRVYPTGMFTDGALDITDDHVGVYIKRLSPDESLKLGTETLEKALAELKKSVAAIDKDKLAEEKAQRKATLLAELESLEIEAATEA